MLWDHAGEGWTAMADFGDIDSLAADEGLAEPGQPVYTLTVASQLLGLAPRTIRAYEEAGLIEPARAGRNRQRLYSRQDLKWLRCIYEMVHEDGYTLRSIRRLLDFAPCWEIRGCPEEVARKCAPALRIPGQPPQYEQAAARQKRQDQDSPKPEQEIKAPVHIKLIYGLQEFGAILHCSRCVRAERTVRKVAAEFGPSVAVTKHDILSDEARRFGVLMTPAIVINNQVVSIGRGLSENKLRDLITRFLAEARATQRASSTGKA